MSWFLGGLVFLVLGYFTYGRLIERILGPDDRKTPCIANPDGVDYVPLPAWKNMLIQLLNIAGIGPVIGVIVGIKFGKIALLIIPVGCVLMGAVHDFVSGFISLRSNGANPPRIASACLGRRFATIFGWFMIALLLLVVAVFINVPAKLVDSHWLPDVQFFWWAVGIIFGYYILATLFPVDAIIGRIYPLFGALLVIGSFAIAIALVIAGFSEPAILNDCPDFADYKAENPIFPCLFVTIACGIISGFHATQSPIVARTMRSEREARMTFYGMMIAEGVIAMIWAAAALAIYNLFPAYLAKPAPVVLGSIAEHFLGTWLGGVTVVAVVVLAITSGDTALRCTRLMLAETLGLGQRKILPRVLITLPLIVAISCFLWWSNRDAKSFNHLWNYFAWGNQSLAATTLMASTVWLLRRGAGYVKSLVTLLPGVFMCMIEFTFILWAAPAKGQVWGIVPGGLPMRVAVGIAAVLTALIVGYVIRQGRKEGSV